MNSYGIILAFLSGLILGAGIVWLIARARMASESQWADRFKVLASDTLRQNHESFLQLAESRLKQSEQAAAATLDRKSTAIDEVLKPVKESLHKMDTQIQALEIKREGAYRELMEMVKVTQETHIQLRGETSQLLQALRTPTTRGRWGEIQLRRILEMTGMTEHARDFSSQHSVSGDNGTLRPDFVVYLPGERCVVIDSKVPLTSYLDASQSEDSAVKETAMKQHARQVREHVRALGAKAYWDQIEGAPDFVVLFMPGDHFLSAALDCDPDLMNYSVTHNVVLATPLTMIALLRTVALSWRQENLRENARHVGMLGGELYASLATMTDYVTDVGKKLSGSLESYNKFIGSLERNVLSKARKLRDFGAAKEGKALPDSLEPIDLQARNLSLIDPTPKDTAA